jgi:cell surface protein SprA
MSPGMPTTYNGSFNSTLIALRTAFKKTGDVNSNYASEVYSQFLANRQVIADRLNARYVGRDYPNTGFFSQDAAIKGKPYNSELGKYDLNSTDVLIPAFLAAYTGRDAKTIDSSPFLSILNLLPNWRLNYDGLTRIPWIREHFKSVSLTHAYTCRYSVSDYTSYPTWVSYDGDSDYFGYIRDSENNPLPSSPYNIYTVAINEQFSPLIGVNIAMKNSMTTRLEYRKQRNLALNMSSTQLIESSADEFVLGLGYLVKDFDVIMRLKNDKQSKIKNDLKVSADISYKDIKTLLRKIQEDLTQASTGNKLFTLKIMADYVFSSKVNLQLFYDRQTSTPLVSTSFPVSSSNFGMSVKFMLSR